MKLKEKIGKKVESFTTGLRRPFLMWWLFFCVMFGFSIAAHKIGIFDTILQNDKTYISLAIIGLCIIQSLIGGHLLWKIDIRQNKITDSIKKSIKQGWFWSDILLSLGMVGTVIGFIGMLSGFTEIDISDVENSKQLIQDLGSGMGIALWTTLTGLIGSLLLKIQYFYIEKQLPYAE